MASRPSVCLSVWRHYSCPGKWLLLTKLLIHGPQVCLLPDCSGGQVKVTRYRYSGDGRNDCIFMCFLLVQNNLKGTLKFSIY